MSPSERSQQKREQVHQAALALFMQYGFEGTSMDAIAATARVSKPTLYRYYPNKEALFIGILSELVLSENPEGVLPEIRALELHDTVGIEDALTDWAMGVLERAMQPEYVGLVRL